MNPIVCCVIVAGLITVQQAAATAAAGGVSGQVDAFVIRGCVVSRACEYKKVVREAVNTVVATKNGSKCC